MRVRFQGFATISPDNCVDEQQILVTVGTVLRPTDVLPGHLTEFTLELPDNQMITVTRRWLYKVAGGDGNTVDVARLQFFTDARMVDACESLSGGGLGTVSVMNACEESTPEPVTTESPITTTPEPTTTTPEPTTTESPTTTTPEPTTTESPTTTTPEPTTTESPTTTTPEPTTTTPEPVTTEPPIATEDVTETF